MTETIKIECPPTPERLAKLGNNIIIGGQGRMAHGSVRERFRNHFELINDPDVDALPQDYGSVIGHLSAARYAYLVAMKASSGWRADTEGEGNPDGMPLVDFYITLAKRFGDQSKAVYAQTGRPSGHWETLMMLIEPLPDYVDVMATRNAMFVIVPQIVTALDLFEEIGEDIQRAWKKAHAPTAEEEHQRR